MNSRVIEIIIETNDMTGGKLGGIQSKLLALDKAAQRMHSKLAALSNRAYNINLHLVDRVTQPGSKINNLLRSLASKAYNISLKINDSALAKIRSVEASLARLAGRAYTVAINVKDNVTGKLRGLTEGALMGMGATMLGTAGIGYGVVNAVQASMGFEKQMSRVQALRQLDKNSEDMKALTELAKELGMKTAWTREQVGQAMEYQALAGWETPQILKATPHMLNLASAGGMDLGAASDMLTDAMTAFGLKATDKFKNAAGKIIDLPEYFADMLAKLQASSNTDLYQAKEAMKYGAPTIGTLFANVEGQEGIQMRTEAARQMMIMTGLMANAGIKGSMAGTGINTIFNRLAGENRNTHFAERLLGLEHAENGNMLMPLDFIKGFQKKIREGMNVDEFTQIAEELAGEKIHADTRRKLNSTIESALKNGGKLGSADIMKMSSMLAGLENMPKLLAMVFQDIDALEAKMNDVEGTAGGMAEDMLDNLAGSFTRLGSAWDAFQQELFTGTAGDGLRGLVDSLTEILTHANNLFKDGIDLSDFGAMLGDVIDRLKNKFLELDGIGSILAGGALMAGLMKIVSTAQKAIGYFKALKGLEIGQRLGGTAGSKGTGAISGATSVGTMNVSAGVVNLSGKINGSTGSFGRTGVIGAGGRASATASAGKSTMTGAAGLSAVALAQQNLDKAKAEYSKLNAQFYAAQDTRDASRNRLNELRASGAEKKVLATAEREAQSASKAYAKIQSKLNPLILSSAAQIKQAQAELDRQLQLQPQLAAREKARERSVAFADAYHTKRQTFNPAFNDRIQSYKAQIEHGKKMVAESNAAYAALKSNMKSAAMGGAAFAAIFGALDVMNAKSISRERTSAIAAELETARNEYNNLRANNAPNDELAQSLTQIQKLESQQAQIIRENQQGEREALGGATGSVLGAAIGAGLGSFLPGFGTTLGGIIGAVIGDYLGTKAAQIETPKAADEETSDYWKNYWMTKGEEASASETPPNSWGAFRESQDAGREYYLRNRTAAASVADFRKTEAEYANARNSSIESFKDTQRKIQGVIHQAVGEQKFLARDNGVQEYYRQQGILAATYRPREGDLTQLNEGLDALKNGGLQKIMGSTLETMAMAFTPQMLMDKLLTGRAHAAELSEEQLLQQAQMEQQATRPRTIGEAIAERTESPTTEMTAPETEPPDFSSMTEQLYSDIEGFSEGISEIFSGIGESISENLSSAFEGVGEVFSTFSEEITEGLTSSFEGISEYFSEIGATFGENLSASLESVGEIFSNFGETMMENLTTSFESAGEMFSGFGELVSSALDTAKGAAESALAAIGSAFETAKSSIQSSWSELPGFFGGIFDGLGGVAASAGAAIAAGLTAPIGSIIGAWQSAASTISGIISSIASMASSAASTIGSISFGGGGGGAGFAEGGFVNSETHFFAGEHGPEVIIPLSSAKRSRALELFEKTAAILGGETAIPASDYTEDMPAISSTSAVPTIENDAPISTTSSPKSSSTSVTMGGLNVTFNITGDKPQEIMQTIKENLDELADRIMGVVSGKVADCFNNQALEG